MERDINQKELLTAIREIIRTEVQGSQAEMLEAMQTFAGDVDRRFDSIDRRFDRIEQRFTLVERDITEIRKDIVDIRSTMVTKDYLEGRLAAV